MEKLKIVKVRNIFQKDKREITEHDFKNQTLTELKKQHSPFKGDIVIAVNGSIIPKEQWDIYKIKKNDYVSIMPDVKSNAVRIIAGVILIALSFVPGMQGASPYLIAAGVGLIIGGVVGLLFPIRKPGGTEASDLSQSFDWSPQTIQQQGYPIPKSYGTVKLCGNIITAFIENLGDKQYINSLICLGLGPYYRLYDFKINDQYTYYFNGVTIETRLGWLNQTVITNFNDTKIEYPLDVKIDGGSSYTYQTSGSNFNGLEVDVSFLSGLWTLGDDGGLRPYTVNVEVDYRKLGDSTWIPITQEYVTTQEDVFVPRWERGRWMDDGDGDMMWKTEEIGTTVLTDHYEGELVQLPDEIDTFWHWRGEIENISVTISNDYTGIRGMQTSALRRTFRINNLELGSKYEIKVSKISSEQTSMDYGEDLTLTSVREVINDDFAYPRHVLYSIKALGSDQLSGSLRASCLAQASYVRVYDGVNWSITWSDNPAWVAYDILTQPVFYDNLSGVIRYDGYDPAYVDTDKFKEWADFCDELLPDGAGSTEKRVTFNGTFDTGTNVWDALLQVCRVGRAVPLWNGRNITLYIDKATSPTQLFSLGNIGVDTFEETFIPKDQRTNDLEIDFVNKDKDYARDVATIFNPDVEGTIQKSNVQYLGVTKPSEIWRLGTYLLAYNQYLTRAMTFEAQADAIACSVGDVVLIQHDVPQWGYGGRLLSVSTTTTAVSLDRDVDFAFGKTYNLLVRTDDDAQITLTPNNSTGITNQLTFASTFSTAIAQYNVYSFGESTSVTKPFRITDIQASEDLNFKIKALEYSSSIYNADIGNPVLPTPNYSSLNALPPVTNLLASEYLIKTNDGKLEVGINIYFNKPTNTYYKYAEIWINIGAGWTYQGMTIGNYYQIRNVMEAITYQVAILTVNTLNDKTLIQNAPQYSLYIYGKTAPPASITNFWGTPSIGGLRLEWTPISDVDIDYYQIRFFPESSSTAVSWYNSIDVAKSYSNSITLPKALSGAYLIKAVDTSSNLSTAAKCIVTNIPDIYNYNSQTTLLETSTWTGTKSGMVINASSNLALGSTLLFDAVTDIDVIYDWDFNGGVATSGYYETSSVDIGSIQQCRCRAYVRYYAVNSQSQFNNISDIDAITKWDDEVDGVSVETQLSVSTSTSASTVFQPFLTGDYEGRTFQFRLAAQTDNIYHYPEIDQLQFNIDMPDRSENGKGVAVSTAGSTIAFTTPFMERPVVSVILQNAEAGQYFELSTPTTDGFVINLFNGSSLSATSGTIDWEARGY